MSKKGTNREQKIERVIRLVWDSLQSHLEPTYNKDLLDKTDKANTHKFHKDCVKEYAEIIKILSELYD